MQITSLKNKLDEADDCFRDQHGSNGQNGLGKREVVGINNYASAFTVERRPREASLRKY